MLSFPRTASPLSNLRFQETGSSYFDWKAQALPTLRHLSADLVYGDLVGTNEYYQDERVRYGLEFYMEGDCFVVDPDRIKGREEAFFYVLQQCPLDLVTPATLEDVLDYHYWTPLEDMRDCGEEYEIPTTREDYLSLPAVARQPKKVPVPSVWQPFLDRFLAAFPSDLNEEATFAPIIWVIYGDTDLLWSPVYDAHAQMVYEGGEYDGVRYYHTDSQVITEQVVPVVQALDQFLLTVDTHEDTAKV